MTASAEFRPPLPHVVYRHGGNPLVLLDARLVSYREPGTFRKPRLGWGDGEHPRGGHVGLLAAIVWRSGGEQPDEGSLLAHFDHLR